MTQHSSAYCEDIGCRVVKPDSPWLSLIRDCTGPQTESEQAILECDTAAE